MVRLLNNKMNVSRNTVYNSSTKGSDHLNKGAVVNSDETWCRSISYLPHVYRDM